VQESRTHSAKIHGRKPGKHSLSCQSPNTEEKDRRPGHLPRQSIKRKIAEHSIPIPCWVKRTEAERRTAKQKSKCGELLSLLNQRRERPKARSTYSEEKKGGGFESHDLLSRKDPNLKPRSECEVANAHLQRSLAGKPVVQPEKRGERGSRERQGLLKRETARSGEWKKPLFPSRAGSGLDEDEPFCEGSGKKKKRRSQHYY